MSRVYPAPAKLNLFLHVVGRRADGYHLLQSVFRLIDRADTVHLELRADGRVVRDGDLPGVPEDRDLTVRAARLLQAHAPAGAGVSIRLDKVLPMGGGLGGGSSDAATVLLALNRLWQGNLPRGTPQRLGARVGGGRAGFAFAPVAHHLEWLAQFGEARMTGSGACVFASFGTEEAARNVLRQLPETMQGFVAQGLDRHPLHDFCA